MWQYNHTDELYHYGIPGMKWGRRALRGHGGPGIYLSKKRQLAGDKRDLAALNRGEHLSVGLTKKRQEAYDKRDRAILEKRIAKNELALAEKKSSSVKDKASNKNLKIDKKEAKEQFKADKKIYKQLGMQADFTIDKKGNLNYHNYSIGGRKVSAEYANKVAKRVNRETKIKVLAGTAGVMVGASAVAAILDKMTNG